MTENLKEKQEKLKTIRQDRIDKGLPAEELESIEKNLYLHKVLYGIMKVFNTISGYEKDFPNKNELLEKLYKVDSKYKNRPIIFAPNHVRMQDIAIEMEAVPLHMVLLSGDFENVHPDISGKLLEKNGIIYLDMDDTKDRNNIKRIINDILNNGYNMLWYYEGSWNFSENKPYYDGYNYIVQAAINSNAIVIPVAFDLIDKKHMVGRRKACIRFGEPIDYRKIYGDRILSKEEKIEGLDILKGEIGKELFDIWKENSVVKRDYLAEKYSQKLTAEDYFVPDYKRPSPLRLYWDKYIEKALKEWKFTEEDIKRKHFVDKTIVEQEDAFKHLDDLDLNSQNAFLLSKRNHH